MFALVVSGTAVSQSMWGINYLGEHHFRGGARDRALGFSSIAVSDSSNALTANPSSLANLDMVTFSLFEVYSMTSMSTQDQTVDQNRFVLPSLTVAVPLPRDIVISTGYHTRFSSRGDFAFPGDEIAETARPYAFYKHKSSLFTAPVAVAWDSSDWLNLALELQIERGSLKDDITNTLGREGESVVESSWHRNFSALSWAAGVEVIPHPAFRLGLYYDAEVDYNVEEEFFYSRPSLDSTVTSSLTLPPAVGIGGSVDLTARWRLMSSYWRREAPGLSSLGLVKGSLNDEWLVGVGVERLRSDEGGFFGRIPLRLGFYHNQWHLQFPAGRTLAGTFFTLGTGFSLPGGPGCLDISLETGRIGSLDQNNLSERVIRLGVGFSVSEPWTRREEDRR